MHSAFVKYIYILVGWLVGHPHFVAFYQSSTGETVLTFVLREIFIVFRAAFGLRRRIRFFSLNFPYVFLCVGLNKNIPEVIRKQQVVRGTVSLY